MQTESPLNQPAHPCAPTITEAREILQRFIASHFRSNRGETARFSIPADPERDDDLRLAAFFDWVERLELEKERLYNLCKKAITTAEDAQDLGKSSELCYQKAKAEHDKFKAANQDLREQLTHFHNDQVRYLSAIKLYCEKNDCIGDHGPSPETCWVCYFRKLTADIPTTTLDLVQHGKDLDAMRIKHGKVAARFISLYLAGRRAILAMETHADTLQKIINVKGSPPYQVARTIALQGLKHPTPDLTAFDLNADMPSISAPGINPEAVPQHLTAEELREYFRCISCGIKTPRIEATSAVDKWHGNMLPLFQPLCPECGQRLTDKSKS